MQEVHIVIYHETDTDPWVVGVGSDREAAELIKANDMREHTDPDDGYEMRISEDYYIVTRNVQRIVKTLE